MSRIEPPTDDCPKCGEEFAFASGRSQPGFVPVSGAEPRYVEGTPFRDDALVWECRRCGYEIHTPTLAPERPA